MLPCSLLIRLPGIPIGTTTTWPQNNFAGCSRWAFFNEMCIRDRGHYELVKLNLRNEEVVQYLFRCIEGWVREFDIDGLRLDVAYCLDRDFLKRLRQFCDNLKPDFFLVGEILGGDYKQIMNPEMLHSATNYECYKGIYSSLNSLNLFEIAHSLLRQFGPENWTLYKGEHLLSFTDNHDVCLLYTSQRAPEGRH